MNADKDASAGDGATTTAEDKLGVNYKNTQNDLNCADGDDCIGCQQVEVHVSKCGSLAVVWGWVNGDLGMKFCI